MTASGADLAAQIAEAVRDNQLATVEHLGREAMLWLAVPPLWTRPAAEAAGFPADPLIDFVRRARDEGWCETRGSLRGEGAPGLSFWMPQDLRPDVLGLLGQGDSRQWLASQARLVAERVGQDVLRSGGEPGAAAEVPDALRYWAELLAQPDPARVLVDRVARAVDAQDLVAAQQLVAAGEALAQLLAGSMELAVDRARRLFSLGSRRRQDARALERYLDRPELSGAVRDLLRPGTERWALHLRGVGGVGKTMLIRYLASGRYAAERDEQAITIARVDFDHMSPDYPVRRPVQLLLELADELALHTAAAGPADRALARFVRMATSVHESLSSVREGYASPTRNPAVRAAIDGFADTLRLLPRPLLILDTCEELAKADAGNPDAPAVSNTLDIIKRIHEQAPEVRVLLAGRRRLPDPGFLAVTPVAGFTAEEAARYLNDFAARPLPDDLVRAIIRHSPAVDPGPRPDGQAPGRVSPFDLALYREWAEEDADLDVARVERGSHAYVQGRIIDRLKGEEDVLRALPVLATAGRCRVPTVAAFLGADPAELGLRLAEQEWIAAEGDPPAYVTAAPALALRLRRYFAEPGRAAAFAAATTRLAAMLSRQVRAASLDDMDGDELLAALRLSDPADAARLWDEVAARSAAEGRWTWLLNITRRVSGESAEEAWPTTDALRAAVLAAVIAASRRVIAGFNPAAAWAEVGRAAGQHPDPEAARCLRTRAALGALPYAPGDAELWQALEAPFGRYESPARMADIAAAAADAAHRLLEAGEYAAARRLLLLAGAQWPEAKLPSLLSSDPASPAWVLRAARGAAPWDGYRELRAWLLAAFGRLEAREDLAAARTVLAVAGEEAAAGRPPDGGPRYWADVILPESLSARIWIEHGLIARLEDGNPESGSWDRFAQRLVRQPDAGLLKTIDGERLAALCLQYRLGHQVIDPEAIAGWAEADQYTPGRAAASSAHDLVPPLFVAIAEAWLAAGDPRRALDHVARHREAALGTRDDEATVRHADAVTVRIARRCRLDDQLTLLTRLASTDGLLMSGAASPDDVDPARLALLDDARRAVAVISSVTPGPADTELSGRPAGWHAWWQCQTLPVGVVPPLRWAADDTDTALAADIQADLDELGQVSEARQRELLSPQLAQWLARPRPDPPARSARPYAHLRAQLRSDALDGDKSQLAAFGAGEPISWAGRTPTYVPRRVLAEMAFDEAELLALRFPVAAVLLFEVSAAAYEAARDDIGRLLAELARVTTAVAARGPSQPLYRPAVERFEAAVAGVGPAADVPFLGDGSGLDGPWRYWTQLALGVPRFALAPTRLARVGGWVTSLADRVTELLTLSRTDLVLLGRTALVGAGLWAAALAVTVLWVLLAWLLPGIAPFVVAGAVVAAAAGAAVFAGRWRGQALRRLADGVAVGAAFPLSRLEFTVLVRPGADQSLTLWAHSRSPWRVPAGEWPPLFAAVLGACLATALRPRSRRRNGYQGRATAAAAAAPGLPDAASVSWSGDGPGADAPWWSGGTVAGRIVTSQADAARPWERIVTAGLGPHAPGRIQWRRQAFAGPAEASLYGRSGGIARDGAHQGTGVHLDAPPSWTAVYAEHYPAHAGPLVQVRHAIGAAVTTTAGARLEVGEGSAGGPRLLLGAEEFSAGDPSLIIIQAEPTAAEAALGLPGGELAERQAAQELQLQLALGVELIGSGAAPMVLLLPALPAEHAAAMAAAIARYARTAGAAAPLRLPDAAKLQAELRALLRASVPPALLDDIVLFANEWG